MQDITRESTLKEIDQLNTELARKDDELESMRARMEELEQKTVEEERRLNQEANASLNKVFAAIPVRCASLESGRFVIRTHDECGNTFAKHATAQEIEQLQNAAIAPAPAAPPAEKKKRNKSSSSAAQAAAAAAGPSAAAHRGTGVTLRVFDAPDGASGGVVCAAVRFRMDYGQTAPRVTVWVQMHNFIAVSTLKPSQVRVTPVGFAFELRQADLGAAHNMVVNWIAVTEPPRNPALQALMEKIMTSAQDGSSGSSGSSELEKAVSKFVHAHGTEAADTNGQTLLHTCASAGDERLVRYLLGKGAKINMCDEHGWTALLCAVSGGHVELALELLASGADGAVCTESGSNCLHYLARWPVASSTRYMALLDALLQAGCDPNAYNTDGDTPVSAYCQRCTTLEPLAVLLHHGGKLAVANAQGLSPLHIAVMTGNATLVNMLCQHGADPNFAPNEKVGSAYAVALKEDRKAITALLDSLQQADAQKKQQQASCGVLNAVFDVQVVEARALPAVANAYAVVRYGAGAEARTDIVAQTQCPIWKRTFKLDQQAQAHQELSVEVWDWSATQSGRLFGKALVRLDGVDATARDMWFPLTPDGRAPEADSTGKAAGHVHVVLRRVGGIAVAKAELDPFVSWSFPKEQWTERAAHNSAPWCISSACTSKGYLLETSPDDMTHDKPLPSVFDHHASDLRYTTGFEAVPSVVYATIDNQPVVVSVEDAPPTQTRKVIVRTKKEDICCYAPPGKTDIAVVRALAATLPALATKDKVRWASYKSKGVHAELQRYDRLVTVTRYKFGLMYAGPHQTEEAQLFDNCETSRAFEEFCDFIGERVTLRGFQGYNGGLDTKNDDTGTTSIYTTYGRGQEPLKIMFHVAPMLPFQPKDPQRVERKRHIGNDVCVLIFKDSAGEDDTVDVSTFVSHFNNIFIVVSPAYDLPPGTPPSYRVAVCCKPAIRPFPPYMPARGNIFEKNADFRRWLLEKLINGERVAMEAPDFRGSMMNTRKTMLTSVIESCTMRKP